MSIWKSLHSIHCNCLISAISVLLVKLRWTQRPFNLSFFSMEQQQQQKSKFCCHSELESIRLHLETDQIHTELWGFHFIICVCIRCINKYTHSLQLQIDVDHSPLLTLLPQANFQVHTAHQSTYLPVVTANSPLASKRILRNLNWPKVTGVHLWVSPGEFTVFVYNLHKEYFT